jgi:hypothetical protein
VVASLNDLCGAEIKPRSLHCATRHAKFACKKKPSRFGRDDRIGMGGLIGRLGERE